MVLSLALSNGLKITFNVLMNFSEKKGTENV